MQPPHDVPTDLILGTAGHIDHGKTSLIRALTGVDTDRLPEEKRRGITIELGFARLDLGSIRFGIVDVPGHERFVRQMLAGATGMDMVMLVVAADDSVKPQTREHLDVLQFLRIGGGVIVLTKCDMADPDWITLVETEVRELVQGTFLQDAPVVRTSATKQLGLPELRAALLTTAQRVAGINSQRDKLAFRMPVDRTFSIAGHGTVVTGSVGAGGVRVGDTLRLAPGGCDVRVRGLHHHDVPVAEVHRGQRAAINLVGVHHLDVRRGQELCEPGCFRETQRLTVQLSLLRTAPQLLKHRATVQLHLGTDEWVTRLQLTESDQLAPGQTTIAQMVLPRSAVADWGQPFVIRQTSPACTIGGGRVLTPVATSWRKMTDRSRQQVVRLGSAEPEERLSSVVHLLGLGKWESQELESLSGVPRTEVTGLLQRLCAQGILVEVQYSAHRTSLVHRDALLDVGDRLVEHLRRSHRRFPRHAWLDRVATLDRFTFHGEPAALQAVVDLCVASGVVRCRGNGIGLTEYAPRLAPHEQRLYDQLVRRFQSSGVTPPSIQECRESTPQHREVVGELLNLAVAEGELVKINAEILLHADVERQVRETLRGPLSECGLSVSQIRELLQTSRKFAVPLCEYLDRQGYTVREGDLRVLGGTFR